MKLYRMLYKAARTANDIDAVTHPRRLRRRAINHVKGHVLADVGFWRWLWR